jgi:hypothetical protein
LRYRNISFARKQSRHPSRDEIPEFRNVGKEKGKKEREKKSGDGPAFFAPSNIRGESGKKEGCHNLLIRSDTVPGSRRTSGDPASKY